MLRDIEKKGRSAAPLHVVVHLLRGLEDEATRERRAHAERLKERKARACPALRRLLRRGRRDVTRIVR